MIRALSDVVSVLEELMATHTHATGRGGKLATAALLAPLRLPARMVEALEAGADALQDIGPIRSDVARIRRQSESLDDLHPALDALRRDLGGRLDSLQEIVESLEGVEDHMDTTMAQLVGELAAVHQTVMALQDDVQRITNRLPDPDEPGPLQRARDALTGGD